MSWVKEAVAQLAKGEGAKVRPFGGSMRGRIESGQLVTIVPIAHEKIAIDDVVFIRWKGNYLLHLIKQIDGNKFLIGNNIGKINGWVNGDDILGKVVSVEN